MNKKILTIGSLNADLTIHCDRMPKLGETLSGGNFSVNCGGKGGNQAVAVGKLGGNSVFFGAVGDDSNGKMLIENLQNNNVEFKGIKIKDAPTGTASITVINGDNFIILDKGANGKLTAETIRENRAIIKECDFLLLQYEIPFEAISEAAQIAKKYNKTVILNPAPFCDFPENLYSLIDIFIPNEHEAELMTGISVKDEESSEKAILKMRKKGIKTVIITLGDKGCVYNDGEKTVMQPAFKVKAVDTTSAGDSFIGALATKLSKGENLKNAVEYATKVSSITVTRYGASSSIPLENEVL